MKRLEAYLYAEYNEVLELWTHTDSVHIRAIHYARLTALSDVARIVSDSEEYKAYLKHTQIGR